MGQIGCCESAEQIEQQSREPASALSRKNTIDIHNNRMVETQPIVTITGVTGFVGSHVAATFLKDGKYKVRGTVRSKTNDAKIGPLKAGLGDLFDELELVEADLLDEASIIKACEGSTYVVHVASPFAPQLPEDELVKPAV